MNFLETLPIEDVCKEIKQKIADEGLDTTEFSLFSRTLSKWLLPNKCLAFYNLNTDSELEFKSKFRILRVRCMDDAVKKERQY
ncbi:hypothetical protein HMI55_004909 [Coelomomyces lativittatus]|nr:hypothetical protein HMI55_004909 [Coelomomyces lativittatus]